jgi:hypothetical protein
MTYELDNELFSFFLIKMSLLIIILLCFISKSSQQSIPGYGLLRTYNPNQFLAPTFADKSKKTAPLIKHSGSILRGPINVSVENNIMIHIL